MEPPRLKPQNDKAGFGEAISDYSSENRENRHETPLNSSPLPTPILSKELSRSTRSRHAATFDPSYLDDLANESRKRLRSDSLDRGASKVSRISWKGSHGLAQSSPTFSRRHSMYRGKHGSLVPRSDTVMEEGSSPAATRRRFDDDQGYDVPSMTHPDVSSSTMLTSSPPRTPPPNHNRSFRTHKAAAHDGEDGADLLLYLANSPTPATFGGKGYSRDFLPSTPPSQHAALSSFTPTAGSGLGLNFGTPGQQFNFADFVNVTPSPAQPPWGGRTPKAISKTPRTSKELRKRLNFDSLVPPNGSPPAVRDRRGESTLQLGEELRP